MPVNLLDDRVVNLVAEGFRNRDQIRLEAIGGQLHTIRQTIRHVMHERLGARGVAVANKPRHAQFGVGTDSGPRPDASDAFHASHASRHILFFGVAERPNLIRLNALAAEILNTRVVESFARRPQISQQFENRILGEARHTARCPNRIALD